MEHAKEHSNAPYPWKHMTLRRDRIHLPANALLSSFERTGSVRIIRKSNTFTNRTKLDCCGV